MGLGSKLKKAVKKVTGGISGTGVMGALTGGLAGAVFGGPAGALAGAGLGYFSGAGQDATNEANAEAVEAANNASIQLWREQAAYNTPVNQVARLRAAGLNPNLFYSQGDTGNMSSSPTMKAAQYDYNYAQAIDKAFSYYSMKNLQAQNANLKAQTDNINAQTALRAAEAQLQTLQVEYFRKYGYFPNQGNFSMGRQFMQDIFGRDGNFLNNLDAIKEIAAQKLNSWYAETGGRAYEMAQNAADKKGLRGRERARFIEVFVDEYQKTH